MEVVTAVGAAAAEAEEEEEEETEERNEEAEEAREDERDNGASSCLHLATRFRTPSLMACPPWCGGSGCDMTG